MLKKVAISWFLGGLATLLPLKVSAAERITFNYPPFGQFYIQVEDIETFVTTGEISSELAYYLNRLPEEQVVKLPKLLSTALEINPLSIAKFSNSIIGESAIQNFGKAIRADRNHNGYLALRGAIIAAAFDPEGLTALNLLRKFPLKTIYLDLEIVDRYVQRGESLFSDRELISQLFFEDKSPQFADEQTQLRSAQTSQLGSYRWQKQTFNYFNARRPHPGYFDLYLSTRQNAPLIVISHGLASNRQTFAYLAEHLASHGFAVAIVEHDSISLNKLDEFLSGKSRFPEPSNLIDQPLDITQVLNQLEAAAKDNPRLKKSIDFTQIGVMGQSFGGYTSLALAGAELIAEASNEKCQTEAYQDVLLDLSSLAKCTFNEISTHNYQLKDDRIKAVMAINPMGKIFGNTGMSKVDIPVAIVSGTNDLMMPPVAEQILPFSWLNQDLDKYLMLIQPGTHFSFLQEGLGVLPVPDSAVGIPPSQAYPTIKALSTNFFQAYLDRQPQAQQYLQSDRPMITPQSPFQVSIIRFLFPTQIEALTQSNQ